MPVLPVAAAQEVRVRLLEPADSDEITLLLDTVQQGDMVPEICGVGKLSLRTEFGSVRLR